jgi:hypothetical protein
MSTHIRPNIKVDGWKFDFITINDTCKEGRIRKRRKITKNSIKITNAEFI